MTEEAQAADRATEYARDVVAGRVVAGRLVRAACRRHLADLDSGPARGLRFDRAAASHAVEFIERFCRLTGGRHEGRPFKLQPWQAFVVGSLFGWLDADGLRRFRLCYVEIAKGNGKSPMAAAIGLYMLCADGEARAEVYAAASKRDQAMVLFRDAVAMVKLSPALAAKITKTGGDLREWNLAHLDSGSFFRPISSEERQSGPRVHCGLLDEVHEHRDAGVVDMMRAGTKGRDQALILEITNSGTDESTVCRDHHDYSERVLSGSVENDAWFAFVCGLDPCAAHAADGKTQPVEGCGDCDDWRDEAAWPKANPNLGVSVTARYLREQVASALGMPAVEGLTKRLNFCLWTTSETAWLPPEVWCRGAGRIDHAALRGLECYGGLDVASKIDVAAFVLAFNNHPAPGKLTLSCRFWIPEATAESRQRADNVPWRVWAREGWVTLTPGDVIDPDAIEEAVVQAHMDHCLVEVATDPWNAAGISAHLTAQGVKVVEFAQTLRNFNEPSKEFQSRLKQGLILHGSNPVLDWMASNVAVFSDRSGNIRPVKPKPNSPKKVDGIIAAVMALGRIIVAGDDDAGGFEAW